MDNKICSKCKTEKPISDFYFVKSKSKSQCWCKKCLHESQAIRWTDRKRKTVELKGGKCCICGYCKNLAALQFHHLDSDDKNYEWTQLRLRKWKDIIVELNKCILVCANCHLEIHYPDLGVSTSINDNNFLNKDIKATGECPVCNEPVFGTRFCSVPCAKVGKRKVVRPTSDELKLLIEQNSYCELGRKFGVSDNAIRKWAKGYGLI